METDRLADVAQLAVVAAVNAVRLDLHRLTVDNDFLAGLLRRERRACGGTRNSRAEQNTAGDQREFFSSVVLHVLVLLLHFGNPNNTESGCGSREQYR